MIPLLDEDDKDKVEIFDLSINFRNWLRKKNSKLITSERTEMRREQRFCLRVYLVDQQKKKLNSISNYPDSLKKLEK